MDSAVERENRNVQPDPKLDWVKRVNPLRVALSIIVGILVIYVAILWERTGRLEADLVRLKAQQAEMKMQISVMQNRLRAVDKRLPMGEFRLGTFSSPNAKGE